jgi:hypothetical protein
MEVVFRNFYLGDEPLTIDTTILSGQTVENPKRLDGYVFRNPDSTKVVDSIIVDIVVTILPDEGDTVVTLPMDMGDASVDVSVIFARLKFESLEGFFQRIIPDTGYDDQRYSDRFFECQFWFGAAETDFL